jgi:hypothetical protein
MVYGDEGAEEWSARRVGCPALQEVESLADIASGGQYSLRDLRIFDLNTLLSQDLQAESDDLHNDLRQAHSTCWAMIQAEKPKVILVLTTSAGRFSVPKITLFGSSLQKAGKTKMIEMWDNGKRHITLVVYGFHPSVYLREDYVSNNRRSAAEVDSANNVPRLCFECIFAYSSIPPGNASHFPLRARPGLCCTRETRRLSLPHNKPRTALLRMVNASHFPLPELDGSAHDREQVTKILVCLDRSFTAATSSLWHSLTLITSVRGGACIAYRLDRVLSEFPNSWMAR